MNSKKKSKKQELSIAKEVEGKTTIASGSLWFQKADVKNDKFLFECKITKEKYFNVTEKIWDKIRKQAVKDGLREPVLVIDFKDGLYRYAVIQLETLYSFNIQQKDIMIMDIFDPEKNPFETKSFRLDYEHLHMLELEVLETKNRILITTFRLNGNVMCVLDWEDFIYISNK